MLATTIAGTGPPRSPRASSASPGSQSRAGVHDQYRQRRVVQRRHKVAIGDLDQVKRIVFLRVKVRTVEGFNDLTKLADGCSAMLATAFGEAGKHTRTGEGYVALPFGLTSEVEMTVELK